MNSQIDRLQPYPFERLNALLAGLTPNTARARVALSIGEPRHAAPDFAIASLTDAAAVRESLATYPPTRGSDDLRAAIAAWIERRFGVDVDPGRRGAASERHPGSAVLVRPSHAVRPTRRPRP